MKLGKLPPKRSRKTLCLSNYMNVSQVEFPAVKAWERPINYGMLGNDLVGDCTCAGVAHMIMNWQAVANAGSPIAFTDDQVLAAYSAITGYNPNDPSTDQGAVELDVLNYWQQTGFQGHKIAGYVSLDCHNLDMIKAAIFLFGGVYTGFRVPDYIMDGRKTWESQPGSPNIAGGHCVPAFGYGRAGCAVCSWGDLYHMNWQFWLDFFDEGYAVVAPEWIKASGVSPTGLDLPGLLNDLKVVSAG